LKWENVVDTDTYVVVDENLAFGVLNIFDDVAAQSANLILDPNTYIVPYDMDEDFNKGFDLSLDITKLTNRITLELNNRDYIFTSVTSSQSFFIVPTSPQKREIIFTNTSSSYTQV
jgi:hypothetical protein